MLAAAKAPKVAKLTPATAITFVSERPTGSSKEGALAAVMAAVPRKGSIKLGALSDKLKDMNPERVSKTVASLVKYGRLSVA